MKTTLICGAALAILGLAAAPLVAQTQTTTSSSSTGYVQTSKIIGTKVKTGQGEEVGVVKDVVLDRSNGCMAYTVLSAGGGGTRVTGQGKLVAVPWSVYTVSPDASYLTVNVERDRIYNAPVFEYSRIGDTAFTNQVYSSFGVSAGATFGREATSTTTAGTTTAGATTNTGSVNSGNNPAPPAAGPNASASPATSPMANASPNANPSTTVPPNARDEGSTKSGTKGRAKSAASPGNRGEEATEGTRGESTSEGTEGSSTKKSSARKSTDEESATESTGASSSKKSSHKKSNREGTTESAPSPGEQE